MSLQAAAQHLASRGRGPDTTLVHMAPSEVAGLHALAKAAGGKLTTNPDTGLPEAGLLSNLLPMIIGAGITAATGGAAAPWMVGLGMGGLEAARTGSLSKGIMAGLGAFGGAGLGAGLMGAGEAALAAPGAAPVAPEAIAPTSFPTDPSAYTQFQPTPSSFGAAGESFGPAQGANVSYGDFGEELVTPPANYAAPQTATPQPAGLGYGTESAAEAAKNTPTLDKMKAGLGNLGAMANMDTAKYGLAALTPALMQQQQAQYKGSGPNPYEYTYDPKTGQYTRVATGTRDAMPQTPRMFYADGGTVQNMSDRNAALTLMADGGQMFAAGGGVSHLGDYSDGGRLLRGPGDGVSDSIPATIADKRPARLADGEFVVPARIVSELGNGSTESGARKLYAMMDRVQKSRGKTTGRGRMAVDSRADRALPA